MKRLTCAFVIACGAVAAAQQQPSGSIPKDLVMLLMRGGSGMPAADGYDIVLGAPAGFPRELLPPGARPLISTVTRSSTMVIAEAAEAITDLTRMDRQMAAAGWTVSPRSSSPPQRGLVGAPPSGASSLWCSGNRYATVMVAPRPEGGSFVRASVTDSSLAATPGFSPCTLPQQMPTSSFADVDMPLLFPPPGSRALGFGGMSGGSDAYDQHLRLETTLPLPEVLKHYRAQIEKHGWAFQSQAVADGIGVVRFAVTSTKNDPIAATFTVTAVPGTPPLEIALRLVRATTMR